MFTGVGINVCSIVITFAAAKKNSEQQQGRKKSTV
jgi:hypothetical protein